ncbi:hypothetical protein F5148DRAFT_1153890 [Russula earlei]|uniref:Uncharacterized protein n=1 Tax=Russula earlei TaxID=71964 RepID=A0ACC0TTN0_9AGAM|nr:hypothetical protein F5148DRAFT_1153890 [Russula earlei]
MPSHDVACAHGISGKQVGVAEGRVVHEDGIDDEDKQLAKGEAGRDVEVERIHKCRVHDLCPAGHISRRSHDGLCHRWWWPPPCTGGVMRAAWALFLAMATPPATSSLSSGMLMSMRMVWLVLVLVEQLGLVLFIPEQPSRTEEEAVEDLRGLEQTNEGARECQGGIYGKEGKQDDVNEPWVSPGYGDGSVNEPEKKGKKNLQKPQHVRAAGSVGTPGMLLLAMACFHTECTWHLIVIVMAIIMAVSALLLLWYHLERGKLVRGR